MQSKANINVEQSRVDIIHLLGVGVNAVSKMQIANEGYAVKRYALPWTRSILLTNSCTKVRTEVSINELIKGEYLVSPPERICCAKVSFGVCKKYRYTNKSMKINIWNTRWIGFFRCDFPRALGIDLGLRIYKVGVRVG